MGKIAVYTRVSSAKQAADDRYSLSVQKERCTQYLLSQGYTNEDIIYYEDAGISGTTIQQRDRMMELLDELQNSDSQIEGVCCYDLSRISRSAQHTQQIFNILRDNDLKFYTLDGTFNGDINSHSAKIMSGILGVLNELFVDQLSEKVFDGMKKSTSVGNYYGGPAPLGYRYVYVNTNSGEVLSKNNQGKNIKRKDIRKQLVIDENEKPIIEMIFNLFTKEKNSIFAVAKYLNKHGFKTKNGNEFKTASVQAILENPTYCSRLFWGKKQLKRITKDGVRIYDKKKIDEINFYDLPRANHSPIISEEIFLETVERIHGRRQIRNNESMAEKMSGIQKKQYNDKHKRMFVNILRCPGCGGKMTSSLEKRKPLKDGTIPPPSVYYKCKSTNNGESSCDGYYSVQEKKALNLIKEDFFEKLKQAFILVKEYQKYLAEKHGTKEQMMFDSEINKIEQEIKSLQKNESKLLTKLDTAIERQLDIDIDSVQYDRFTKIIKNTEQKITEVRKEITTQQKKIKKAEKRRDSLLQETQEQEEYSNMEEYFNSLSLPQKRELLEKVYSKIVINTISNARKGPKKASLGDVQYNEYSNVLGLCEILGVQDFEEFNEYLKNSGRSELSIFEQHFVDVEDYIEEISKNYHSPQFKKYWNKICEYVKENEDTFTTNFIERYIDENKHLSPEEFEQNLKNFGKNYGEAYRKHLNKKEEAEMKKRIQNYVSLITEEDTQVPAN